MPNLISVVIPLYNTRDCLEMLYSRLLESLNETLADFEIIFVDDNSPQADHILISKISKKDERVKLVKLSRNFGQQAAISCGISYAKGDWVVVMDADLQDRPEEISSLYQKALEGYDIVFTEVNSRRDNIIKKLYSKAFHTLFAYLTGSMANYGMRNFGIYSRKVVDAFLTLEEQFRGFALLVRWLGFNSATIQIQHDKRETGKSSYDFSTGLSLALDSWVTFSDKPLRITVSAGFLISLISFMIGLFYLLRALLGYRVVLGWTSLILSVWFLSGFTVFCIGLIGLYIGKVFKETKKRPHYLIDYTENLP
ncbi:MAG: glycosyltransferase family 2 protein [Candidatus Cloacimonadaceae bacterium]|nr:glycosyltransferase family 2 protein [Candidatus Cloacimonadaceae bacterium]